MNETPKQQAFFFEGIHEQFRPENIPADWLIFNAPRPLYASAYPDPRGRRAEWRGDFRRGIFYVAVNPADPQADMWVNENNKLDAAVCVWVTADEVVTWVKAYYAERYPGRDIDYDRFEFIDFAQTYRSHHPASSV